MRTNTTIRRRTTVSPSRSHVAPLRVAKRRHHRGTWTRSSTTSATPRRGSGRSSDASAGSSSRPPPASGEEIFSYRMPGFALGGTTPDLGRRVQAPHEHLPRHHPVHGRRPAPGRARPRDPARATRGIGQTRDGPATIFGRGEIAQLVEHTTENRGVPGSSPGLAIAENPRAVWEFPPPGHQKRWRIRGVGANGSANTSDAGRTGSTPALQCAMDGYGEHHPRPPGCGARRLSPSARGRTGRDASAARSGARVGVEGGRRAPGRVDGSASMTSSAAGTSRGSRTARRVPGCCSSSRRSTGGSRAGAPHERRAAASNVPAYTR